MPRLTFSNVPTASGGVISGNISIGAGSPFGTGGKYEAQVAGIQAEIAKAPEGFYDPVGWEAFLRKGDIFINPTDLSELEDLQKIHVYESNESKYYTGYAYEVFLEENKKRDTEIKIREDEIKQDILQQFEEYELEQAKKKALELEMARPPKVSVFVEPPPEIVTVAPPDYVKPEKPPRVPVFVEPPPQTVTVAPPGYEQPEKPPRVPVFDPSTESAFDPFGGLLEGVFGEPTEVITADVELPIEPELEVTTADVELPIEPELEVTTADVELPIEPELEVTTADVEPPIEPELEVTTVDIEVEEEVAPTEERPVKWIPEPFFSFINEVFSK